MNTVEKVKALCKERGVPISKLERECGFANGYIGQLKKGTIPDDRAIKIAEFFDIDVRTLIGSERDPEFTPEMDELFALAKKASPEEIKQAIRVFHALIGD